MKDLALLGFLMASGGTVLMLAIYAEALMRDNRERDRMERAEQLRQRRRDQRARRAARI